MPAIQICVASIDSIRCLWLITFLPPRYLLWNLAGMGSIWLPLIPNAIATVLAPDPRSFGCYLHQPLLINVCHSSAQLNGSIVPRATKVTIPTWNENKIQYVNLFYSKLDGTFIQRYNQSNGTSCIICQFTLESLKGNMNMNERIINDHTWYAKSFTHLSIVDVRGV